MARIIDQLPSHPFNGPFKPLSEELQWYWFVCCLCEIQRVSNDSI